MDMAGLHRRALDETARFVAAIGDEQWGATTPCTDWDVHALLNHLTAGNLWVAALATGATIDEVGDRLDGDVLGSDPKAAYLASANLADEAFSKPGAMQQTFHLSMGAVPGEMYAMQRFLDVLVHGWDIATATGQDTGLDPELVSRCYRLAEPFVTEYRATGAFGDEVPVDADADDLTRLLALLGRTPA